MVAKRYRKNFISYFILSAVLLSLACAKSALNPEYSNDSFGIPVSNKAAGENVSFQTVLNGSNSLVRTQENLVITTQEQFIALLERIYDPRMKIKYPSVDFAKSMAIACFMGEQSNADYLIKISNVAVATNEIVVTVDYVNSASIATPVQVPTQSFDVVTIPKSTLPVRFVVERQNTRARKINLPFRTLLTGQFSKILDKRQVVIKDPESLKRLFNDMGLESQQAAKDSTVIYDVDFNQEMIIAVFRGEQFTGGKSIAIDAVHEEGNEIFISIVNVDEDNAATIQVITQPYCLIAAPLSKFDVVFTESTRKAPQILPADTVKTPPDQQEPLLHFYQEGGIAGINRMLSLYSGMTYTVTDNRTNYSLKGTFSAADSVQIAELFHQCDFFNLKDTYGVPGSVKDQMVNVIYYREGNNQKKIGIWDDPNDAPPAGLQNVEDFLNRYLSNLVPQNPKPDSSSVPPVTITTFVRYTQEGGIAGFNRNFTVYDNLTCVYENVRDAAKLKGVVDKEKVAQLLDLAGGAEFLNSRDIYGKQGAVTDQMTRVIQYESGDVQKKVAIRDDPNDPPPQYLLDIEQLISQILTEFLKQNTK